jgi:hypothetical protein
MKNTWLPTQVGTARHAMLNSTRCAVRCAGAIRNDMTSPSTAATEAPAAGLTASAAMMLNVSDSENVIGTAGTRSVE